MDSKPEQTEEPQSIVDLLENATNAKIVKLQDELESRRKEWKVKNSDVKNIEAALAEIELSDLNDEIPVLVGEAYENLDPKSAQKYLVGLRRKALRELYEVEDKMCLLQNQYNDEKTKLANGL